MKATYKLRDWVPLNKANKSSIVIFNQNAGDYIVNHWDTLSIDTIHTMQANPHPKLIEILETNPDKINWKQLSRRPEAICLIKKNLDKVNWRQLSANPAAIDILLANPEKINWMFLSSNPSIVSYIEHYWDKIDLFCLSRNPAAGEYLYRIPLDQIDWHFIALRSDNIQFMEEHITYLDGFNQSLISLNPNAIPLLERNPNMINWLYLSRNPNAISLLEANQDKINWDSLCENPNAIHLIEANLDKINLASLCENPNAIHIIEANRDQLDSYEWNILSINPSIFTLDYHAMYVNMTPLREELLSIIMHPDNISRLCPDIAFRLSKKRKCQ